MCRAVMRGGAWVIVGLASACGPVVDVGGDATTSGGGGTTGDVVMPTTVGDATTMSIETTVQPEPTPPMTTVGDETTSTNDYEPPVAFLLDPDGGGVSTECDVWAQACPPGEKCVPWSNDGGNSWNALRCSPVADDPREVGESCTVEGSGVSGIDDCGLGAMCWNVDPETNVGECVAFCQGSEASPTCADPCMQCAIYNDGVLTLCLPMCDPLAQDCDEGQGCQAIGDLFICAYDVGENGQSGDPCDAWNLCDPGLYCGAAELLPDCIGESCCTRFCDIDEPDPCNAIESGTVCAPWHEVGAQPKTCLGEGTVGVCIDAQ